MRCQWRVLPLFDLLGIGVAVSPTMDMSVSRQANMMLLRTVARCLGILESPPWHYPASLQSQVTFAG